jgi:hypothetical protein
LLPAVPPLVLPLPLMLPPALSLAEPLELGEEVELGEEEGDDGLLLKLFEDPLLPGAFSRWQATVPMLITAARIRTVQDCLRITTLLSLRLKCPYASLRLGRRTSKYSRAALSRKGQTKYCRSQCGGR